MSEQLFYTYNSGGDVNKSTVQSNAHKYSPIFDEGTHGIWAQGKEFGTYVIDINHHYTPATASGKNIDIDASGGSESWGTSVVSGVTLNTDGKGHITGISVDSVKTPQNLVAGSGSAAAGKFVKEVNVSGHTVTASYDYAINGLSGTKGSNNSVSEITYSNNIATVTYSNVFDKLSGTKSSNNVITNIVKNSDGQTLDITYGNAIDKLSGTKGDNNVVTSIEKSSDGQTLNITYGSFQVSGNYSPTIVDFKTAYLPHAYSLELDFIGTNKSYFAYIPLATGTKPGVTYITYDYLSQTFQPVGTYGVIGTYVPVGSAITSISTSYKTTGYSISANTYDGSSYEAIVPLATGTKPGVTYITYDYLSQTYQPVGSYGVVGTYAPVGSPITSIEGSYQTTGYLITAKTYDNTSYKITIPLATGAKPGVTYITYTYLSQTFQPAGTYVTKTELSSQSYAGYSYVYSAYNYVLDVIEENEFIIAQAFQAYVTKTALSSQSYAGYSYVYNAYNYVLDNYVSKDDLSSQAYLTQTDLSNQSYLTQATLSSQAYAGYSYVYDAYNYVLNVIEENESIVAQALVDLNEKITTYGGGNGGSGGGSDTYVTSASFTSQSDGVQMSLGRNYGTAVTGTINSLSDTNYGVAKTYYDTISSTVSVNAASNTSGRWYGVQPTKDGRLVVNVPWDGGTGGNAVTYTSDYVGTYGPIYQIAVVSNPGNDPNTLYVII